MGLQAALCTLLIKCILTKNTIVWACYQWSINRRNHDFPELKCMFLSFSTMNIHIQEVWYKIGPRELLTIKMMIHRPSPCVSFSWINTSPTGCTARKTVAQFQRSKHRRWFVRYVSVSIFYRVLRRWSFSLQCFSFRFSLVWENDCRNRVDLLWEIHSITAIITLIVIKFYDFGLPSSIASDSGFLRSGMMNVVVWRCINLARSPTGSSSSKQEQHSFL